MATDSNDIPQGVLASVARGLESTEESFFIANDLVDHRTDVRSLNSEIPVRNTKSVLRREENRNLSARGEAKPYDRDLETVPYRCLRQPGAEFVTNEEVIEFDEYGDLDPVEEAVEGAMAESMLYCDLEIRDALKGNNNTSRTTVSASAAWSDQSNATPISDFDSAFNEARGADTIVMGRSAYQEFSQLPDVYSEISNFDAGSASRTEVEQWLMQRYSSEGLERVHIVDKFYDENNEGQDHKTKTIADEECFVYHRDAVMAIDPNHELNPDLDQEKTARRSGREVFYEKWFASELTTSDKVVELTGI